MSLEPSPLQAKLQLSHSVFIAEVLQSCDNLVAFSGPTSIGPHLFCAEDSKAGCNIPDGIPQEQSRGEESPPSISILSDGDWEVQLQFSVHKSCAKVIPLAVQVVITHWGGCLASGVRAAQEPGHTTAVGIQGSFCFHTME